MPLDSLTFLKILDNAGDMIVVYSSNGTITATNSTTCKILGFTENELIGCSISRLFSESYASIASDYLKNTAESSPLLSKTYIETKAGSKIPVEINCSKTYFVDQQMGLCILRDVTDGKVAEELLRQYAQELESSNDLKDLFVDILKHDLINPINSANGFSDILLKIEKNDYKKDILEGIKSSIENMSGIIDLASRFARFEMISGVDKEQYDISILIKKTISDFEFETKGKNITVDFEEYPQCFVSANGAIKEVFVNFMSNAIKYSPENTNIQINISNDKMNNRWKVEFLDEGLGVEDEYKPLIFNRFERGNTRGIKGTGLGLAIVKRVADLHDMEVGVSDNPSGQGSCFWITLQKAQDFQSIIS